jgi:hypothetical protein
MPFRNRAHRAATAAAAAAALLIAAAAAGCGSAAITPSPTPMPTAYSLLPTPWPNGTVGQYGLHIDPALIARIPAVVGGNPLVEDAAMEIAAMDDKSFADAFSGYFVAHLGDITDLNWLQVSVGTLNADAQGSDFYTSWRDGWFGTACSQAGGTSSTTQEWIGDWQVDEATCAGGVMAYTLTLDDKTLVSIMDLGPRRLGRQLITAIK